MTLAKHLTLAFETLAEIKGKVTYGNGKKESCTRAFELGNDIVINLLAPRMLGISSARISCYDDSGKPVISCSGSWISHDLGNDKYEFRIKGIETPGIYFYSLQLSCCLGNIYATASLNSVFFSGEESLTQFTVSNFRYPAPKGIYGGVIYHIFVDRFARCGKPRRRSNARLIEDWSDGVPEYPEYPGAFMKNNTFFGGDLFGIAKKLPYISSLGVTAIYLSPIFESPSNHKYDTADYMRVDSMLGGDRALKHLIREAEKLGISVILDGVFNHTGSDSIYFNRYGNYKSLGAYQSADSPYYSWYSFDRYPDKYTCWWGIDILPRINPDNRECGEYFTGSGGVIERYARMGIGGIRLDVADELSDKFIASIKACLCKFNPRAILYGEVWEDASNKIAYGKRKQYYLGAELDGVMNYPLRAGIIEYICHGQTDKLLYSLTDIINNAPKRVLDAQMNLLGSHDTERILTALGAVSPDNKSNSELRTMRMSESERSVAISRLKAAYTVLSTLPGIPTIFYGDEVGLEGYSDPFNRMPFPWGNENAELLSHYRRLGLLRRKHRVYEDGEFSILQLERNVLIFSRKRGQTAYVTVFNNSNNKMSISFSAEAKPLVSKQTMCVLPGAAEVYKTAHNSTVYYKLER